jgi:hypothetical protein
MGVFKYSSLLLLSLYSMYSSSYNCSIIIPPLVTNDTSEGVYIVFPPILKLSNLQFKATYLHLLHINVSTYYRCERIAHDLFTIYKCASS